MVAANNRSQDEGLQSRLPRGLPACGVPAQDRGSCRQVGHWLSRRSPNPAEGPRTTSQRRRACRANRRWLGLCFPCLAVCASQSSGIF